MIKSRGCCTAACDVCGATPESGHGSGQDHFDDPAAALEHAREADWWATDAVVLCADWDVEHIAGAREIAASLPDGEALDGFRSWVPDHIWDEIKPPGAFAATGPARAAAGRAPSVARAVPDGPAGTSYARYGPGCTEDPGVLGLWCKDHGPDPVWTETDAEGRPASADLGRWIAVADDHERRHHGALTPDQPATAQET